MPRPKVKVFERKVVNIPGSKYTNIHEGFFVEISYETEINIGESENEAVQRALNELQAEITTGRLDRTGSTVNTFSSIEDRLRKVKGE